MRKEIRQEIVIHPELGELTKKFIYIWDEKKYPLLDEAISIYEKTGEGIEHKEFYIED